MSALAGEMSVPQQTPLESESLPLRLQGSHWRLEDEKVSGLQPASRRRLKISVYRGRNSLPTAELTVKEANYSLVLAAVTRVLNAMSQKGATLKRGLRVSSPAP